MRVIVTGGNSGVGKATAAALVAAGHDVVIACRTVAKGAKVAADMARSGTGTVGVCHLDLADLTSVRKFADSVESVDVLVNNAGVLGLPLTRTADGFETHMGTNHLGHFALTCLLGDRVTDRVISVASAGYVFARMHLDDLNWHTRAYSMWAAYEESKLANLLFVYELNRRGITAYASDPGVADSDVMRDSRGVLHWLGEHLQPYVAQSLPKAARASIQAVTTDLPGGTYLAPRFKMWGKPKPTSLRAKARDPETARRLWELSAELTGCDLP
jgi:NAD(P)-dependent dehydrogenase (short-subunit alcohol dehydrogenase family)